MSAHDPHVIDFNPAKLATDALVDLVAAADKLRHAVRGDIPPRVADQIGQRLTILRTILATRPVRKGAEFAHGDRAGGPRAAKIASINREVAEHAPPHDAYPETT